MCFTASRFNTQLSDKLNNASGDSIDNSPRESRTYLIDLLKKSVNATPGNATAVTPLPMQETASKIGDVFEKMIKL
jgi:hypothetical protein